MTALLTTPRHFRWVPFIVPLLLATACGPLGDNGPVEDNEPLIAAVAAQMSDYESVFGVIDGDCFARDVVSNLGGTGRIEEEYGFSVVTAASGTNLLDNTFSRPHADVIASGLTDCGYWRNFLTTMALANGLQESDVDCLVEEHGEPTFFGSTLSPTFMDPSEQSSVDFETVFFGKLRGTMNSCGADIAFTDWFTVSVGRDDG